MYIVIGPTGQDGSYVFDLLDCMQKPTIGIGRNSILRVANVDKSIKSELSSVLFELDNWVEDWKKLERIAHYSGAQTIIDCAASHSSTHQFGRHGDIEMYKQNTQRLMAIERALIGLYEANRPTRFVTCGSSLMYKAKGATKVDETTKMDASTGYGLAKVIARKQCAALRKLGIEASMAILFNHDSPRRGDGYFLPRIIKSMRRVVNGFPAENFGNLDRRIDIGSARDVAQAVLGIAQSEIPASDYIVATGKTHLLRELVDCIGKEMGISNAAELCGENIVGTGHSEDFLVGDISKIQEQLGWSPKECIFDVIREMVSCDKYE